MSKRVTSIRVEEWKLDLLDTLDISYSFIFNQGFASVIEPKFQEGKIRSDLVEKSLHRREQAHKEEGMKIDALRKVLKEHRAPHPPATKEEMPAVFRSLQSSLRNAVITVFRNNGKDLAEGAREVSDLVGRTVTVQECQDELVQLGMAAEGSA